MKSIVKIICRAVVTLLLAAAIVPRASAQNRDDDNAEGCGRAAGSERRRCEGHAESPGNAVSIPDDWERLDSRLRLVRLGDDLSYLRDATEYLSRAARSGALDFRAIAKSASEIRRRAARIKDCLTLPSPRKSAGRREEKVISDSGELRAALAVLSAVLSGVLRNHALTGYTLDAAKPLDAANELDAIVELSGRVKAGSESLAKTTQ
ncbi:MAG: hypothetical protein ACJ74Q_21245 [Pyrinomonadaceae bacterium]